MQILRKLVTTKERKSGRSKAPRFTISISRCSSFLTCFYFHVQASNHEVCKLSFILTFKLQFPFFFLLNLKSLSYKAYFDHCLRSSQGP